MAGCSAKTPEEVYESRLAEVEPFESSERQQIVDLLKEKVSTTLLKEEVSYKKFFVAFRCTQGDPYINVVILAENSVKDYSITSTTSGVISAIIFNETLHVNEEFIKNHAKVYNPEESFIPDALGLSAESLIEVMELKLEGDKFILV